MSNKKILHVTLRLSGGGSEKQIMKLLLSKSKEKLKQIVIVFKWCKNCIKLKELGVEVYLIKEKYYNIKSIYSLYKIQNKLNPNVIISWMPTIDFFLLMISLIKKIPIVINERTSKLCYEKFKIKNYRGDLIKTSIIHNYLIFKIFILLRFVSLKYCRAIIVNSKHMKKHYSKNFPNKDIFQINNIINQPKEKVKKYIDKNFAFLIVSRFVESKNIDLVIKAFSQLRKKYQFPKLIIIGKGYYHPNKVIKNLDVKIKKNIKIFSNLNNWFTKFDKKKTYFIHPSLYEGQPNVVLEAAISKFPLILSNIPAHTDLFPKKFCIYFNPLKAKDVYLKMVKALHESNELKKKKVNSVKKILNHEFNEADILNKYNLIFKKII